MLFRSYEAQEEFCDAAKCDSLVRINRCVFSRHLLHAGKAPFVLAAYERKAPPREHLQAVAQFRPFDARAASARPHQAELFSEESHGRGCLSRKALPEHYAIGDKNLVHLFIVLQS